MRLHTTVCQQKRIFLLDRSYWVTKSIHYMFEMRPSVESRRPKIKLNSISKPIASRRRVSWNSIWKKTAKKRLCRASRRRVSWNTSTARVSLWMRTKVAPRAGAWVEISSQQDALMSQMVAPRAGAWIEISNLKRSFYYVQVAPPASARIEMGVSIIWPAKTYLNRITLKSALNVAN